MKRRTPSQRLQLLARRQQQIVQYNRRALAEERRRRAAERARRKAGTPVAAPTTRVTFSNEQFVEMVGGLNWPKKYRKWSCNEIESRGFAMRVKDSKDSFQVIK